MYEKLISAYVTNLGKYTEGELVGKWLDFPTTQTKINTVLKEIGIDGTRYEEIFITDYESNICGLTECFGEYESLFALNYLAEKIQELKGSVLERYIDYEAYGRDVRLEEGGIYTHNGYYVYMIDSPRIQSEEVWGAIQEMKEDMKRIA